MKENNLGTVGDTELVELEMQELETLEAPMLPTIVTVSISLSITVTLT